MKSAGTVILQQKLALRVRGVVPEQIDVIDDIAIRDRQIEI